MRHLALQAPGRAISWSVPLVLSGGYAERHNSFPYSCYIGHYVLTLLLDSGGLYLLYLST